MRSNVRKIMRDHPLMCYMTVLIAVKLLLTGGLFIWVLGKGTHDDGLMVNMSWNLLNGNWLGAYDQVRMIKGITFPVFLALNHLTGIPYITMLVLLYGLACVVFVKALEELIKSRFVRGILFTVLLFAPVNVGYSVLLRVYRNSLSPTLALVLVACFIKMYFVRGKRDMLFWSLCGGVALAAFWNLREDYIWMLPFTAAVAVITIIRMAIENQAQKSRWFQRNLVIAVFPFLVLGIANTGIKTVNYLYYGTFVRNELSEGAFPEFMRAVYSVAPEEDITRVSVPRSTIEKLYTASPSFRVLQPVLDKNFGSGMDGVDGDLDGQIKDGWMFWCLRNCVVQSGYITPDQIDAFYQQAASEIFAALDAGQLPRRNGMVMPSALMSPWKESFRKELPRMVSRAFWHLASHEDDELKLMYGVGSEREIRPFEELTHNLALMPVSYDLTIRGWIISKDDKNTVDVAAYQGDTLIAALPRSGGADVYAGYPHLENARNSRFDTVQALVSEREIELRILKNGQLIDTVPLSAIQNGGHVETEDFHLCVDMISLVRNDYQGTSVGNKIAFLEAINEIYRSCGKMVTIISLLGYFVLTMCLINEVSHKRQTDLLDRWLVLSGLIGSVMVLCVGLAYTHISAYSAINPGYSAGGKPLLLAFDLLTIIFCGQKLYWRVVKNLEKDEK